MLYAGHFPRFHPSDFRVRTLDGVADDWPIDYATLEPFYDENDRMMGVSGLAGDPAYPPHEPMMPPLPLGKSGTTLARGHEQARLALVAVRQRDRLGRLRGPRASASISAIARRAARRARRRAPTSPIGRPRIRAGVELRTRCRVREITTNEHGMASGVVYYDADGVEHFQPAEVVILACNGVGTPRLLLNSASARFPNGLANSSGLVGKNLMFHPYARIATAISTKRSTAIAARANCIWSQEFYETDRSRGFVRGYTFRILPRPGAGRWPPCMACRSAACPGARNTTALIASCSATAPAWWRSARTCRRSTTASRSIRC